MAVAKRSSRLLVGDVSGKVFVLVGCDIKHELSGHKGAVTGVALDPTAQRGVSVDQTGQVLWWNTGNGSRTLSETRP